VKYFPLIWAGIWRKPARTIFTLLSVVVAFILFGVLMGVNHAFDKLINEARMDRLFTGARYGQFLPRAYLDEIAHLDGVVVVSGAAGVFGTYQDPMNNVFVLMADERIEEVHPEWTATPQQLATMRRLRTGAIITEAMAKRFGWKTGDRVAIETPAPPMQRRDGAKSWAFDIVAVVPDVFASTAGQMFGNYEYLDEARVQNKGTVGFIQFLIKDPTRGDEIAHAIDRRFANSGTPTRSAVEKNAAIAGIQGTIDLKFMTFTVVGAALFMVLFLTGNVMAQSVRERLSEFAVLKTVGYSDRRVTLLVLAEAVLPCVAGALLGVGASYVIASQGRRIMPPGANVPLPNITGEAVIYALALALVVALASGLPAVRRLRRLSIVDALAGR
jgi:putative ABC transport system permease protein